MTKTIHVDLSVNGISRAIKELEQYAKWVEEKTKELTQRCADIGLQVASVGFAGAMYDGTNDVVVTVEPTENGYKVVASGEAVCFIEFGAGVYYNGAEPYPIPRPAGVVGIGQFGAGQGTNDRWVYRDYGSNQYVVTHGNPAAMPMYNASKEIEARLASIAKEVFAG